MIKHKTITLELDLDIQYDETFDPSWGADADGHRGTPTTFIDDIQITNLPEIIKRIRRDL